MVKGELMEERMHGITCRDCQAQPQELLQKVLEVVMYTSTFINKISWFELSSRMHFAGI